MARKTRPFEAVVRTMGTIIRSLANFPSLLGRSSLLILGLSFTACSDSSVGPGVGGAAMGRIYAGNGFTCGIVEGGRGLCWGLNDRGQVGGTRVATFGEVPEVISEDLRFRELSTKAAGRHVCGLTTTGDAYCWGENRFGQLGDGTTDFQMGPQLVLGGLTFTSIAAGWRFSCGITIDEAAHCWGRGEWGQLGDGLATLSSVPTEVSGGHKFRQLDVGSNNLVCGVTTAGSLLCWGLDLNGALGAPSSDSCIRDDGLQLPCSKIPQQIASDERFIEVSAGSSFACGVTLSLQALCWGRNDQGQLGNPGTETCTQGAFSGNACAATPVPVSGRLKFVTVAAGLRHTCGVTIKGDAYCWGRNTIGELGSGVVGTNSNVPALVRGGVSFRRVTAGDRHSCGEGTDGQLYCWGSNQWGQLGTGDTHLWLEPALVVTGFCGP